MLRRLFIGPAISRNPLPVASSLLRLAIAIILPVTLWLSLRTSWQFLSITSLPNTLWQSKAGVSQLARAGSWKAVGDQGSNAWLYDRSVGLHPNCLVANWDAVILFFSSKKFSHRHVTVVRPLALRLFVFWRGASPRFRNRPLQNLEITIHKTLLLLCPTDLPIRKSFRRGRGPTSVRTRRWHHLLGRQLWHREKGLRSNVA